MANSTILSVRLTGDQLKALDKAAAENGKSRSEMVRIIITTSATLTTVSE